MMDDNIPTSYDLFSGYEMTVDNVIKDCELKTEFLQQRLNDGPDGNDDVLLPENKVVQRRNNIENCIRNNRKMISWLTELKEFRKGRAEKALRSNAAIAVLSKVRNYSVRGLLKVSDMNWETNRKLRELFREMEQVLVDAEVLSNENRLSKPIEKDDSGET